MAFTGGGTATAQPSTAAGAPAASPGTVSETFDIQGARVTLTSVANQDPNRIELKLETYGPAERFRGCTSGTVEFDGQSVPVNGVRHSSRAEASGIIESMEVTLNLAAIDTIASAQAVSLLLCGIPFSWTPISKQQAQQFAGRVRAIAQQSGVGAPPPATGGQAAQPGTQQGAQQGTQGGWVAPSY